MLIGGDDISNDVITLGTCFSMFVYIRARFRFVLIGGNLTAYSARSHRGIGGGMGHLHDDIIYYYDQNPSGFSFLVQITAFVMEISLGLPNLNMKRKTKRILVVVVK